MSPQAILTWLGLSSLTATLLTGAVLLLRRPAGRAVGARAAMWLWAGPALRLVLPPLGLGLLAWPLSQPLVAPSEPRPAATPVLIRTAPAGEAPAAPVIVPVTRSAPSAVEPGIDWPSPWLVLLGVWLGGAAAAGTNRALATSNWRRTLYRERCRETPPRLDALLARTAREAGYAGPVTLVLSAAAASPQVIGLRRPVIAVPDGFADTFSQSQQRLALLHECTHLARRDLWTLALAEGLCALHWFNPLLGAGLKAFRADQEAACDEAVRAHGAPAADYAGTLLHAARGPFVPALTLNHDLKRRIETMTRPLPRTGARLLGSAAALALAVGAAAATQASNDAPAAPTVPAVPAAPAAPAAPTTQDRRDDPNAIPARAEAPRAGSDKKREVHVYSWSDDHGEEGSLRMERGGETEMVLLSDPFAGLMPERPEPPAVATGRLDMRVPEPPTPPAARMSQPSSLVIVDGDGNRTRRIDLEPGERIETEGGAVVIVPPTLPENFDRDMEAFEARMEEWSETFEAEFGEDFEAEMDDFGERMGDWGEKMGAVGEAVGELAERCEAHRERTTRPAVLEARIEGSGEAVKAVCARGGAERYASVEMDRFVERQRGLTGEEKAAFAENRARGGLTIDRR